MHEELHDDGDFVIYKVEVLRHYSNGPAWQEWRVMYHDDEPPVPAIPVRFRNKQDRDRDRENEPFTSETASGACWQKTGIHGFFDRAKADKLVAILIEHNPGIKFRILEQRISQHTRVVAVVQSRKAS